MKKTVLLICGIFLFAVVLSAQVNPLVIDFQFNVMAADAANNYLSFSGPYGYGKSGGNIRTVTKDYYDATTKASLYQTTALLSVTYQTDIAQKAVMPSGLRGLLLFGVSGDDTRVSDNVNVTRASNGVITVQYAHRGTAYRLITNAQGQLTFPKANCQSRVIGYISDGAQVIARDFSTSGEAKDINWTKVWDNSVAAGRPIASLPRAGGTVPATAVVGAIVDDPTAANTSTIFHYTGNLQFTWDGRILRIKGTLPLGMGGPR